MEPAAAEARPPLAGGASPFRERIAAWRGPLAILGAIVLDAVFLHAIWLPLESWGIWDWDYQMSLVEAARKSLLEYGELPLWNPWMGGGATLVGHPLARCFDPLFLPVLVLGTVVGLKLDILLYLLLGQIGMYRLARTWGAQRAGAVLAALVFSWSGSYAQHLTHGHVEWMAYAWVPWLLVALERAFAAPGLRPLAPCALFLALAWLDGGPYQYAFVPLAAFVHAGARGLEGRSAWPLAAVAAAVAGAAALAAVQLAPVLDTVLEFPRETEATTRYYQGPLALGAWDVVRQAFFARDQLHDPGVYMPFRINVGAYLGVVPVALAGLALLARFRALWPLGLSLLFAALLFLSDHLPLSLWELLHPLPGFRGLRVPARFNFFVVLWLAGLAGLGLDLAVRALRVPEGRRRTLAGAAIALVAADLFLVCAPVYGHAFVLPPFEIGASAATEADTGFRQHGDSPYRGRYAARATRRIWNDHWPSEVFPVLRRNQGVIRGYPGLHFLRRAIPSDHPAHPGAEVAATGQARVLGFALTPNTVTFTVEVPEGEGEHVIVNQNHHRWWRIVGGVGRIEPQQGRLAVRVPPGRHELRLSYRPTPFFAGAAVSALAWPGALALAWPGALALAWPGALALAIRGRRGDPR